MKKLCLLGAFLCSIFMFNTAYSQCNNAQNSGVQSYSQNYGSRNYNQSYGNYGAQGGVVQGGDCPCDQPCGNCYCQYVHYEPCYYTTQRCIEEQVPYTRKCCRYVPQYYEVQRCRYVPQYYTETCCRQVPEYYDVQEYRCCKRTICEPQCKYIPRYYWKHECRPSCAPCGQ